MMTSTTQSKKNKWLKSTIAFIFWIGVWALVARIVNKELLIPYPWVVAPRILTLFTKAAFWQKTGATLLRILGGFAGGVALGSLFAVLAAFVPLFEAIVSPFVRMIRSTPVASFVILVMLWVGYTFVPAVIAGLMVMPIMYMNTLTGLRETDKKLLEVAKVFRFDRMKTMRVVYIPSVKPYFMSAAVTAFGLSWKAGIAAEVLCLPKLAIGSEIFYSKIYLETPDLFAWTAVIVIISVLFEEFFGYFVKPHIKREEAKKDDKDN